MAAGHRALPAGSEKRFPGSNKIRLNWVVSCRTSQSLKCMCVLQSYTKRAVEHGDTVNNTVLYTCKLLRESILKFLTTKKKVTM